MDIENDACVPPGVISKFLDCHFEKVSGHFKHIFLLSVTHLPCFDPCSCEMYLSLLPFFVVILF